MNKSYLLSLVFFYSAYVFTQESYSKLIEDNKYKVCLNLCEDALKKNDKDSEAYYYKGVALFKLENFEEAKLSLKSAEKNNYANTPSLNVYQIKVEAALQETDVVINQLESFVKNGFQFSMFLDDPEFNYLKNNEVFNDLALQLKKKTNPCVYEDNFKKLDFWLGEWDVYFGDAKFATSSITKSKFGCTLHEKYIVANNSYSGRSMSYYDTNSKLYKQLWIDKLNGKLEFKEVAARENYLQMVAKTNCDSCLSRMTYQKTPDRDEVIQSFESSKDNGKTWESGGSGTYKRRTTEQHQQ